TDIVYLLISNFKKHGEVAIRESRKRDALSSTGDGILRARRACSERGLVISVALVSERLRESVSAGRVRRVRRAFAAERTILRVHEVRELPDETCSARVVWPARRPRSRHLEPWPHRHFLMSNRLHQCVCAS